MAETGWPAVEVMKPQGQGGSVVLCEHASAHIPAELQDLGLAPAARYSHIAWDPGALDVARNLAARLGAPLVAGGISRLVYDCNRPPDAPDCIPEHSEIHAVPGNRGLSDADRRARFDRVHQPFHAAVDAVFAARADTPVLVTVHSFTPVYRGERRTLDIGYLFHSDGVLARAALAAETETGRHRAALNAPYDASDGVTYSLRKHGEARGLKSVMIEIRNDLIDIPAKAAAMADHLADILDRALAHADAPQGAPT